MINFKEKYGDWALVTGASSGIGKAFCIKLASMGINIVGVARNEEKLHTLKLQLEKEYKVKFRVVVLDLSTDECISAIKEKIKDISVSILINNAGSGFVGTFYEYNHESLKKQLTLNCITPIMLSRELLNSLTGRGALIFVGSVVAHQPTPYMGIYSSTKAFLETFAKTLWYELKSKDIDVLIVSPGTTDTNFTRLNTSKNGITVRKPEQVVDTAIKSLGKKILVVDGTLNKLMVFAMKVLPLRLQLLVTGFVAGKLYESRSR